jgi:hypothetical protein
MARDWLHRAHQILLSAGKGIGSIWIMLGVAMIWASFPVAALAFSNFVAAEISHSFGGGALTYFGAFLILVSFFGVYVWHPYIRPATEAAALALMDAFEGKHPAA